MTFLSCLSLGAAFAIAVALLIGAGLLIGWTLPDWIAKRRRGDPRRNKD